MSDPDYIRALNATAAHNGPPGTFFASLLWVYFPEPQHGSLRTFIWEHTSITQLVYEWFDAALYRDEWDERHDYVSLHRQVHDAIWLCAARYVFEPIGPLADPTL